MRFAVHCRQCHDYHATFGAPQEVVEWLMGGHLNGHGGHLRFTIYCDFKPLYAEAGKPGLEFRIGDQYVFATRLGNKSDVIALGPDGRTALFDRVSPLTHELEEGLKVRGEVMVIGDRYMIVKPITILGVASPLDAGLAVPWHQPAAND